MILVDSSVLLDLFTDDPKWGDWSERQLSSAREPLAINPIIYSEVSVGFEQIERLEELLYRLSIKFQQIPREALFLAGKAFARYKKRAGTKTSVLPDFFIGAHAAVSGHRLLTRDELRVRGYFPTVRVISPAR